MKTKNKQAVDEQVTQAELRKLADLEAPKHEALSLRKSIRSRILAGAKVEPGPCSVSISERPQAHLTRQSIYDILGMTLGNQLLDALPRRRIYGLRLKPNRHTKHTSKPKPVFETARLQDGDEPGQEFDLTTFVLNAITLILNKEKSKQSPSGPEIGSVDDGVDFFGFLSEFDELAEELEEDGT